MTTTWKLADERLRPNLLATARNAAFIAAVVFSASTFGILTRPIGLLADVWPANALLLGLLLRNPGLASPWTWAAAFVGYVTADLAAGGGILITLWLTAANLAGVTTGFILFRRLSEDDRRLQRPASILYFLMINCTAAIVAASTGGPATMVMFGRDISAGIPLWFTAEFVSYMIILPAILTAPDFREIRTRLRQQREAVLRMPRILTPIAALVISIIAGIAIGGPGAIVFPVPALLWCALSYSLFTTACLVLIFCLSKMTAVAAGIILLPASPDMLTAAISTRLGIALLALAPLTAASINTARNTLLRQLDRAASHDSLTDALVRNAFLKRGDCLLEPRHNDNNLVGVLMLDLDRFKNVNDQYGHLAGDKVLAAFSSTVSRTLRENDLFGRLGGEEFAVILPGITHRDAARVAERIRTDVEKMAVELENGKVLHVTVSIGFATSAKCPKLSLETLLSAADRALYKAKEAGRNRVVGA